MPSGPLIGDNFEATTISQSFKTISDTFSIVSDETHLALEAVRHHTLPKALTKAPSRGKEHAAHIVMTKVDVADTLVPALEPEPEAVVEDCPDVRDIALNCLRIELPPLSECAEDGQLSISIEGLLRLWKDGIRLAVELADHSLLLIL